MISNCSDPIFQVNSNLTYKNYEAKFERNSVVTDKVLFTKYGNIKRFSMWALNEWYSDAGVEVKLCNLPTGAAPDYAYSKYMAFDADAADKVGYVSIHDNALYLLPITFLGANAKIVLQDVYF